jgi:hypothetical protein
MRSYKLQFESMRIYEKNEIRMAKPLKHTSQGHSPWRTGKNDVANCPRYEY